MKKKLLTSSLHLFIGLAGLGLIGIAMPGVAQAVDCGDTIQGDVSGVDITCDGSATDVALVVQGPARLSDSTVTCVANNKDGQVPIGIKLEGRRAVLNHVTVRGCHFNIHAAGEGRHRLRDVDATSSVDDSILVSSNRNHIRDCNSSDNGGDGLDIEENFGRTIVRNCTFNGNGFPLGDDEGVDADGHSNRFINITANDNADNGVVLNGDRNVLVGGEASRNTESRGVEVDGKHCLVAGVTAEGNKVGIRVDGASRALVLHNTADKNIEAGVEIDKSSPGRNIITGNKTRGNGEFGIKVEMPEPDPDVPEPPRGFGRNAIANNEASENGMIDLKDANQDCGNNRWRRNVFNSSEAGEEPSPPCIE